MDNTKLDAGMTAALRRNKSIADRMYPVFIHTSAPINEDHVRFLNELGAGNVKGGMKVVTATLPAPAISILSDQEWVSAIRLSRKMQPI